MPLISVVMGVYNGRLYLSEAIESILNQSFIDFEFLIVNDGSTDNTLSIIKNFKDSRIKLINEQNRQGLTKCLNKAIKLASGKYIARMDADDVADKNRFQEQVTFLENNPEIVVVGTSYQHINEFTNQSYPHFPPRVDEEIRAEMLNGNPFCHPSVMMRKDTLKSVNYYDESFPYIQDYELWSRMAQRGKLANLPKVLLFRRYHTNSISNNWKTEIYRWRLFVKANHLAISRLNGASYLKLLTYKTIALFALGSIKNSWSHKTN